MSANAPSMLALHPTAIGLRPMDGPEDIAPRSELLLDGQPTGKTVAGLVLEAAFRTDSGELLLFTADDTPFEEMLNIQLLDAQLDPLDSAVLGAAYSTGSFGFLAVERPDSVRFRFIGDTDWVVEVLPEPRLRTPWAKDPVGVSRPWGLHTRLRVSGNPKPET